MKWTAWAVESTQNELREGLLLITGAASGDEPRAPVVVNLALDRSGSMKGAPLAAAVEAAQQFVDLATPEDFLGLLLFDGVAEQRVPVCAMDTRGKRAMVEALASVTTGRGTALYAALETAARGLQRTLVPGRQQRVLLLTDGEPSVGPDTEQAFADLGRSIVEQKISVHALGLAKHYVAEVLQAVTQPSGNAFEHVDGPEGLSEAMGAVMAHLFGQVAADVQVRVRPVGFSALTCRHLYPSRVDGDDIVVTMGDVSRGFARRVLLSGGVASGHWSASVTGTCKEGAETRLAQVNVERVSAQSRQGELVVAVGHELDLVASETSAWLSLARKDLERAEVQLEDAEKHLRQLMALDPDGIPARRHLERLGDLRLAVERGEGDIPLLIRRAQSARAGTNVSQVIPMQAYRKR